MQEPTKQYTVNLRDNDSTICNFLILRNKTNKQKKLLVQAF